MDTNKKGNEMRIKYYRIKLFNKRAFYLDRITENDKFILGRKVNRFGKDNSYIRKSDGMIIDKQDMIFRDAIESITEMKMNNHYGELE